MREIKNKNEKKRTLLLVRNHLGTYVATFYSKTSTVRPKRKQKGKKKKRNCDIYVVYDIYGIHDNHVVLHVYHAHDAYYIYDIINIYDIYGIYDVYDISDIYAIYGIYDIYDVNGIYYNLRHLLFSTILRVEAPWRRGTAGGRARLRPGHPRRSGWGSPAKPPLGCARPLAPLPTPSKKEGGREGGEGGRRRGGVCYIRGKMKYEATGSTPSAFVFVFVIFF